MESKEFSFIDRIRSFTPAFKGLMTLLKEHHNARIHLAGALAAISLGLFLKISAINWIMISFAISLVFAMELLNSSIEKLADLVTKERSESMRKVKDMSAAAVLVSAIGAALVGIIIFWPKIHGLF